MKNWFVLCAMLGVLIAFSTSEASFSVSLNFDTLPSQQGWLPNRPNESDYASINNCVLTINTMGLPAQMPEGYGYYGITHVENTPITVSFRARVVDEWALWPWIPSAFIVGVKANGYSYFVALGKSLIQTSDNRGANDNIYSFDNTVFHDYTMLITPGTPEYTVAIDNMTMFSGFGCSSEIVGLSFGDPGQHGKGRTEITSFSAIQAGSVVPIPGAVWLLGSGLIGFAGLRGLKRKLRSCNVKSNPGNRK